MSVLKFGNMKNFTLILILSLIGYGIYITIKNEKWKSENCEKIFYKKQASVCVEYSTRPMPCGKIIMVQKYCSKYKDTIITDWKYKCPENE